MGQRPTIALSILCFLFSIVCVLGQQPEDLLLSIHSTTPSAPSVWYPTNVGTPNAWWNGDNVQTNSAGAVTNWPDSWANAYHLIETASNTRPTNSGTINGHLYVEFDGVDDCLRSTTYTNNSTLNHEIWLYALYYGPTNAASYFFDSTNSTYYNILESRSVGCLGVEAGTLRNLCQNLTNMWVVYCLAFSGANSFFSTNYVPITISTPGTKTMSGLYLGRGQGGNFSKLRVPEIITYGETNTGPNRSNIFWYLTNKYGPPT